MPSTAAVTPYTFPFGVGAYLNRVKADPGLTSTLAGLAQGTNTRWTREEFNWRELFPATGQVDSTVLAQYDRLVETATNAGLEILGLIAYANPSSSGSGAPSNASHYADFANYVSFLVQRYKGVIRHWEIWNEPNTATHWPPAPNPANYAELLKRAYAAAKAVYPQVTVLGCSTAGLGSEDLDFINQVLAAGGGTAMDGISVHPYTRPTPLEVSPDSANFAGLQSLLESYGLALPIWVTEIGYSTETGSSGISDTRQAQLLVRSMLTCLAAGVKAAFWYDLRDDWTDPTKAEDNFGLVTFDNQPKEAYTAFAVMNRLLNRSPFVRELTLSGSAKALLFRDSHTGLQTLALWVADETEGDGSEGAAIPLNGTVSAVLDINGLPVEYSHDGATLTLTLTGSPVYVLGSFDSSL